MPRGKGLPQCKRIIKPGTPEERRCKNRAVTGSNMCRMHGGTSPVSKLGPGNIQFKHGRYSEFMERMNVDGKLANALNDPDRLKHAAELQVLDVLLTDTLDAIGRDAGASERLWQRALDALLDFETAMRSQRHDKAARQMEAFLKMKRALEDGQRDAHSRMEARRLIKERAELADRETARQAKAEQSLSAEQARLLAHTMMIEVADILRPHPELAAEFNRRMFRLFGNDGKEPAALEGGEP